MAISSNDINVMNKMLKKLNKIQKKSVNKNKTVKYAKDCDEVDCGLETVVPIVAPFVAVIIKQFFGGNDRIDAALDVMKNLKSSDVVSYITALDTLSDGCAWNCCKQQTEETK